MSSPWLDLFLGTCDLQCFLDGLGSFPACKNEVTGSYNLLSGYDGDPTSFSTTDADLWYADLVKYEGKGKSSSGRVSKVVKYWITSCSWCRLTPHIHRKID